MVPNIILTDITIEGIALLTFPDVIALLIKNTAMVTEAIPIVMDGPKTNIIGISSPT